MNAASASAACAWACFSISGWTSVRAKISARAQVGTTIHRFLPSMPSAIAWPAFDSG